MADCLHDLPAGPLDLPGVDVVRIETRPTVQTWLPGNPVIPGSVWCWTHRHWEALEGL